jgi:D-alanyl-D-alanine carboxypeptidase
MSLAQVSYTSDNPFGEKSQLKIRLESKILRKYLKMMNAKSKNSLADQFFDILGGRKAFHEFINLELNTDQDSIDFYTGSGLIINQASGRKDNLATCELSIDLIKKVSEFLSAVEIEDIMDYAPHKEGTLSSRFESYQELKRAVSAKTGTLNQMPTYVLGGVLSGKLEKMPFVIINQPKTRLKLTSRKFQEVMLNNLSTMTGLVALEDVEKIESSFVENFFSEVPEALLALTNSRDMLH